MKFRNFIFFLGVNLIPAMNAAADALYIARPGQVLNLVDQNADGDFFEVGEVAVFTDTLPATLGPIVFAQDRLYVVDTVADSILAIRDANGDGDALDFNEIATFAVISGTTLRGLVATDEGTLYIADDNADVLYRITDLNADGDAFDASEIVIVASGLTNPTTFAIRPDGLILLAQNTTTMPVRILHDRNADGDFFGFAENISYAENAAPGGLLLAPGNTTAYMTPTGQSQIVRLQDLTADNDVLDVNEIILYAPLAATARALVAAGNAHLVALSDPGGTLVRVRDDNLDGDALDFNEVQSAATGLTNVSGMVHVAPIVPSCIAGDANENAAVEPGDISLFVQTVLGQNPGFEPCRFDMNMDGAVNGRDVAGFVEALLD